MNCMNHKLRITSAVVSMLAAFVIVLFALSGCGSSGGSGVSPKLSVDDYTWDELSKISGEIGGKTNEGDAVDVAKKYNLVNSDGKLDGSQTKTIQLTDGSTVTVQIAGFLHDDKTGGGKAGITFIFKDAIAKHVMNSSYTNLGGWEGSGMRSWLGSSGLSMLPQDLTNVIVEVDKKTNNIGETTSTSSVSSVTTTSDKLWLFSATELCGAIGGYVDECYNQVLRAEGTEYKLFRDCNVAVGGSNGILQKKLNGSSCNWWERSPIPRFSNGMFYHVTSDGDPDISYRPDISGGVIPGFCI